MSRLLPLQCPTEHEPSKKLTDEVCFGNLFPLSVQHERHVREKEQTEREMRSDMKKLMKEIQKLQKRLMMKDGRRGLASGRCYRSGL